MMNNCSNEPNDAIKCTVNNCKFHCNNENFCSLEEIRIGSCQCNPCENEATNCQSFEYKG